MNVVRSFTAFFVRRILMKIYIFRLKDINKLLNTRTVNI